MKFEIRHLVASTDRFKRLLRCKKRRVRVASWVKEIGVLVIMKDIMVDGGASDAGWEDVDPNG